MSGMFPRTAWRTVKRRLRRRPAFSVDLEDRQAVRRARDFVRGYDAGAEARIHVLPINSMQWSSVVIGTGGHHLAVIDVEQANAVSFLMARSVWLEKPIFSYVEFMIRAAEVLFDDGDIRLAYRVAERANARLHAYARDTGDWPGISRPQAIEEDLVSVMRHAMVLRGITGHEIGHLLQKDEAPTPEALFQAARDAYDGGRFEEGRFDQTLLFDRYIKPETIQKFIADGKYDGDVTLGTRLTQRMPEIADHQQREVEADALGLLTATEAAAEAGVHPDRVFGILFGNFEATELLMMLRRLLPQLPRGTRDGHVLQQMSNLCARQTVFIRLIGAIREGPDWAGAAAPYWADLSEDLLARFEAMIGDGRMEQMALRATILARGGLNMGLQGEMPPHPGPDYFERLHPAMRGNLHFQLAHLTLPTALCRIEETHDWHPGDGFDGLATGFAAAIRDLADLFATDTGAPGDVATAVIRRDGSTDAFVEMLRSPRSQVFAREADPDWRNGFERALGV